MAEMMALVESLHELQNWLPDDRPTLASVWTDSKASIDAVFSPVLTQPLAVQIHDLLVEMRKKHIVTVTWVQGHSDVTGNEYADHLARRGRDQPRVGPFPALYTPPNLVKNKIREYTRDRWEREWVNHTEYRHSRAMLSKPSSVELITQGKPPFDLNKEKLQLLIEVITGHSLLGTHLSRWHSWVLQNCRLCNEGKETYQHIIQECPATAQTRYFKPCEQGRGHIKYFEQILDFTSANCIQALRRSDIT